MKSMREVVQLSKKDRQEGIASSLTIFRVAYTKIARLSSNLVL